MPSSRLWACFGFLACANASAAAQLDTHKPPTPPVKLSVVASPAPSAALLEFLGEWNEGERELIHMNEKVENAATAMQPLEGLRAP